MRNLLVVVVALIALGAGGWLATSTMNTPEPQFARLFPQPRALAPVALENQHGDVVDTSWFENKWTLTFVGYTYCPDICPTTLGDLKSIYAQLQQMDSDYPVEVMFISVDPKRDSIPRLKEYIDFFNPEFHAVTGEHKQLFPLVRSMGMMYEIDGATENNDYLVNHSGSVVIINPNGHVIGRFKPESVVGQVPITDSEQILADMPLLIERFVKESV